MYVAIQHAWLFYLGDNLLEIKKGSLVIDSIHAILYGTLLGIKKASLSLSLLLYTHSTPELAFKDIPTKPLQDQHNRPLCTFWSFFKAR
jgi:hypothetical protein